MKPMEVFAFGYSINLTLKLFPCYKSTPTPRSPPEASVVSNLIQVNFLIGRYREKLEGILGESRYYLRVYGTLLYCRSFSYPDKVRGIFNEGGLFGERQGWHLPGFDTSSWADRNLSSGLPNSSAGVGFFVSTFDLQIPSYNDVFISFTFDQSSQPYRAYLFVNGWMMGKRVANLGLVPILILMLLKLIAH